MRKRFFAIAIFFIALFLAIFIFYPKRGEKIDLPKPKKVLQKKDEEIKILPTIKKEEIKKEEVRKEEVKKNLPPSIESISVSGYEGEFQGFDLTLKSVDKVEVSIPTAVRILVEKKLPFPTVEDKIIITLKDRKAISLIYSVTLRKDGVIEIFTDTTSLAFNYLPVYETLSSAILEGLLTKREGNFAKIPLFLRRSFCTSLTSLNEYIEKREILRMERENEPFNFSITSETSHPLLNGLLFIKFIEEKSGMKTNEILNVFLKEDNYLRAIEKICFSNVALLESQFENFSKDYLKNLLKNSDNFSNIVSYLRQLKEDEAINKLNDFIKSNPTDIHFGEGLYYLGWANYRIGNYKEAENIFINLINNYSFLTISIGKTHYFLGRCYELLGYKTLAYFEYKNSLLEDNELLRKVSQKKMKELEK